MEGFLFNVDVIPKLKKRSGRQMYPETKVYRVTRLYYHRQFIYFFLTGTGNVQFYFKTRCPVHSYKICPTNHQYYSCKNRCLTFKNMIITGLKEFECQRVNIVKVERTGAKIDFAVDEFCNDINRFHMQKGIYEGDYIKFTKNVTVDENGLAEGLCFSDIEVVPVDNLTESIDPIIAAYDIETYTNGFQFSNAENDHIITIAVTIKYQDETIRICLINSDDKARFDDNFAHTEYIDGECYVLPFANEKDMIACFFDIIYHSNPDEVIDYNGDNFDIPYILTRMEILKMSMDCIKRYDLPDIEFKKTRVQTKLGYSFNSHSMVYYNHTDLYQYIKNSRDATKMENMKLDTVSNYYLNVGKVELSVKEMIALYKRNQFAKIVKYNIRDTILPIEVFIKCQVANKLYADTAIMSLSRDDYLKRVSHRINVALFDRAIKNTNNDERDAYFFNKFDLNKMAFKKKEYEEEQEESNEDEGDKIDFTTLVRKRVPVHVIPETAVKLCPVKSVIKFTGGKVLSPNPGYYNLTFTLDFSQLYTSIMIAETICLSNLFIGTDGYLYLQKNNNAITTKFLLEMSNKRAEWKADMKKHEAGSFMYNLYDSWQDAAKLVCNSIYGWLGMFCKPLANYVTFIGRTRLEEARKMIEDLSDNEEIMKKWNLSELKLKVIYGDTDSNFVNISLKEDELETLGKDRLRQMIMQDILKPVNDSWGGHYKMELENIMTCMLIKGKKSYICLKENNTVYKRGFNVKKDIPLFLRNIFDHTIGLILRNHSLDCVLKYLVDALKKKKDDFSVASKDEYSFSQTLNINVTSTIAYKLYMELKESPDTKLLHDSGDRIPYLLLDVKRKNVKDKAWPTQLYTEEHNMSWCKHLGIVCTFINDIMAMINNDDLFVYAFEEICTYLQSNQINDVVYPFLKALTDSKKKDLLTREMNLKNKKLIGQTQFESIVNKKSHKFIHEYEFSMSKTAPSYRVNVNGFSEDCPVCNGKGVAAVNKQMKVNLLQNNISGNKRKNNTLIGGPASKKMFEPVDKRNKGFTFIMI
ncbi:DNA polymerase [Spodoptera litura granulovirus]|uniref:DNA-directed DNA polymerase n=1 Tax=Spodoptera litura granulovirus TaxID=359919 RepID=A5IZV3_9BBAC|nr:DNA polymerase [Spodoptera litura granulovirus]ABQ52044.1 DNA polymerase [Spodoptera litura granulovirus]